MPGKEKNLMPQEVIEKKIFLIREKKVMLDKDLAELYGVTTGNLNKAVKRNIKRFPDDFMFQLTKEEMKNLMFHFGISSLRSQIGTSSWGGSRHFPYAFTEQGVVMLSSVLNSEKAIQINIQIIRAFVKMREIIISNKELRQRLDELEKRYDKQFKAVFDVIKSLLEEKVKPKNKLGFVKN